MIILSIYLIITIPLILVLPRLAYKSQERKHHKKDDAVLFFWLSVLWPLMSIVVILGVLFIGIVVLLDVIKNGLLALLIPDYREEFSTYLIDTRVDVLKAIKSFRL